VTLFSLAEAFRRFGKTYCFNLQVLNVISEMLLLDTDLFVAPLFFSLLESED
jgi:hypothetical protein